MELTSIETNSYKFDLRKARSIAYISLLPRLVIFWMIASTLTAVSGFYNHSPMGSILGWATFNAVLIFLGFFIVIQGSISPKVIPGLGREKKFRFTSEHVTSEDSEGTTYTVPLKDLTSARVLLDHLLIYAGGSQVSFLVPLSAFNTESDRENAFALLRKFNLLKS